jgi:hypothetical protein
MNKRKGETVLTLETSSRRELLLGIINSNHMGAAARKPR